MDKTDIGKTLMNLLLNVPMAKQADRATVWSFINTLSPKVQRRIREQHKRRLESKPWEKRSKGTA